MHPLDCTADFFTVKQFERMFQRIYIARKHLPHNGFRIIFRGQFFKDCPPCARRTFHEHQFEFCKPTASGQFAEADDTGFRNPQRMCQLLYAHFGHCVRILQHIGRDLFFYAMQGRIHPLQRHIQVFLHDAMLTSSAPEHACSLRVSDWQCRQDCFLC